MVAVYFVQNNFSKSYKEKQTYLWARGRNAPKPVVVIVAAAAVAADVGVSVGGQWATGDRRRVMAWWWVVLVGIGVEVGWLVWSWAVVWDCDVAGFAVGMGEGR